MAKVVQSLARFLFRSASDIPRSLGSSFLGVWFPIVPAVLLSAITCKQKGWAVMIREWVLPLEVTISSYLLLFLYCMVRKVYTEHRAMKTRAEDAESKLKFLRDRPKWADFPNEQAWQESIDHQNRMIEIGRILDGVLSPLQMDTFRLGQELRLFAIEVGPRPKVNPNNLDGGYSTHKHIMTDYMLSDPWFEKLRSGYKLRFADRVKSIRFKLGKAGCTDANLLDQWMESVKNSIDLFECARTLDRVAIEISDKFDLTEYTADQIEEMSAASFKWKVENEPGFAALSDYYQSSALRRKSSK